MAKKNQKHPSIFYFQQLHTAKKTSMVTLTHANKLTLSQFQYRYIFELIRLKSDLPFFLRYLFRTKPKEK
jgi:hypothetical protein